MDIPVNFVRISRIIAETTHVKTMERVQTQAGISLARAHLHIKEINVNFK